MEHILLWLIKQIYSVKNTSHNNIDTFCDPTNPYTECFIDIHKIN